MIHDLTAEQVRRAFDYDPATGLLTRRDGKGEVAGYSSEATQHYVRVCFNDRSYRAHRLIWLHQYGEWPEQNIDHRNGNRADNRLSNLRLCNQSENQYNIHNRRKNATGFTGVARHKRRYRASIYVEKKRILLGMFDTPEDASRAYESAKVRLHTFADVSAIRLGGSI